MTHQSGLLSGPKFNGKHTTLTHHGKIVVKIVKDLPEVTKILPGVITPNGRCSRPRIKLCSIPAGFRISVRGTDGIQELYVYTQEPKETEKKIREGWNSALE